MSEEQEGIVWIKANKGLFLERYFSYFDSIRNRENLLKKLKKGGQ